CALAAVAVALHPDDPGPGRRLPATAPDTPVSHPATPLPARTPAGLLDLGGHTLTVGDRVMRVDSHSFGRFTPGSELTVTAKNDAGMLPVETEPKGGYEIKVPYLVELRAPDGNPVYAGALAFDMKALAGLETRAGWVGMSPEDAQWFFGRVGVGDRVALTSTVTPGTGTPTADTVGGGDRGPEPQRGKDGRPGLTGGRNGSAARAS
ncbi:hypothetical protein ACPF8X_17550, partial [Streptomyces sp. G35A]